MGTHHHHLPPVATMRSNITALVAAVAEVALMGVTSETTKLIIDTTYFH